MKTWLNRLWFPVLVAVICGLLYYFDKPILWIIEAGVVGGVLYAIGVIVSLWRKSGRTTAPTGSSASPSPPRPISSAANKPTSLRFGFWWGLIDLLSIIILFALVALCFETPWKMILEMIDPTLDPQLVMLPVLVTWTLVCSLIAMFLLSPLYAVRSANAFEKTPPGDPNRWFVIFTQRVPNKLQLRTKGGKFADFVGKIPRGRTFFGATTEGRAEGLNMEDDRFWELVEIPGATAPTGYELHKMILIRLLARWIHLWSDVALVGIRWTFDIHEYRLEKFNLVQQTVGGKTSLAVVAPDPLRPNISREVRVAPFRWVVYVAGAETKSRIPVNIITAMYLRVTNPMRALRNQENWSQFTNTSVMDIIVRGLRGLSEAEVFELRAATSAEEGDLLTVAIRKIQTRLRDVVGIEIDDSATAADEAYSGGVQLVEIEPVLTGDAERAFTTAWVAERNAQATRTAGGAEADAESMVIDRVAEAVARHGDAGALVQRFQALENVAKSPKGATTILDLGGSGNGGGGSDETKKLLTAILAELQKPKNGGSS